MNVWYAVWVNGFPVVSRTSWGFYLWLRQCFWLMGFKEIWFISLFNYFKIILFTAWYYVEDVILLPFWRFSAKNLNYHVENCVGKQLYLSWLHVSRVSSVLGVSCSFCLRTVIDMVRFDVHVALDSRDVPYGEDSQLPSSSQAASVWGNGMKIP